MGARGMTTPNAAGIAQAAEAGFTVIRERLQTEIWRQRVSHKVVGGWVGVSGATFGKKLRGEVRMTVPELLAIARALELDLPELVGGEHRLSTSR